MLIISCFLQLPRHELRRLVRSMKTSVTFTSLTNVNFYFTDELIALHVIGDEAWNNNLGWRKSFINQYQYWWLGLQGIWDVSESRAGIRRKVTGEVLEIRCRIINIRSKVESDISTNSYWRRLLSVSLEQRISNDGKSAQDVNEDTLCRF